MNQHQGKKQYQSISLKRMESQQGRTTVVYLLIPTSSYSVLKTGHWREDNLKGITTFNKEPLEKKLLTFLLKKNRGKKRYKKIFVSSKIKNSDYFCDHCCQQ